MEWGRGDTDALNIDMSTSSAHTTTHNHTQPHTTTHNHTQPHTTTHNHTPPHTTTHNHTQPRRRRSHDHNTPVTRSSNGCLLCRASLLQLMEEAQRLLWLTMMLFLWTAWKVPQPSTISILADRFNRTCAPLALSLPTLHLVPIAAADPHSLSSHQHMHRRHLLLFFPSAAAPAPCHSGDTGRCCRRRCHCRLHVQSEARQQQDGLRAV